jgi:NAD(P) transhydrogenase subunit alpha
MGAQFLELDFSDEEGGGGGGYAKQMSDEFIAAEMALFAEQAKEVDIIITTCTYTWKTCP